MKLSIALCTYNGEEFLVEQLASIARQTRLPDELVVCDDGSTDGTPEILRRFSDSALFPVHIHRNERNLGLIANFSKAIGLCRGDWVALCDQDDSWLTEKLEHLARKMTQMESAHGQEMPLLVHSDAIVTDGDLWTIDDSLWRFQVSHPQKGERLNRLLSQNVVTGCTMLFNRALSRKAMPVPGEAMMHDWWLALVAATFGRIAHIPEATIRYRQHELNDTGAKSWDLGTAARLYLDLQARESVIRTQKEIAQQTRNQALTFLERFGEELSGKQKTTIKAFIDLPNRSYLARKTMIVRYGLHYHGILRNIGNLLLK